MADIRKGTDEILGSLSYPTQLFFRPSSTHIDFYFNALISVIPGESENVPQQMTASETDRHLECDHDFILTSGARFRTDHTNLCIGVIPIATSKLSEILWSWLVGSTDTVNKLMRKGSLRRVWYHMLGIDSKITFLIYL